MANTDAHPSTTTTFGPTPAGLIRAGEGHAMRVVGETVTFIAQGTGGSWSLFAGESPEKIGPPRHRHPWDETYYVTSGTLEVLVGDTWLQASTGDTVVVPGGVQHTFHGLGGKAGFLIFVAPKGVEEMFDEIDRDAREMPPVIEKLVAIAKRHNAEILGPPGR